jgi:hypothetical protein
MSKSLLNRIYVCQAVHIMKTLNVLGVIVAVAIIALAGIAIIAAAAASLLVQSASATTDLMTTTTSVGGGEQEAVSSTNTTTTNNNASNAALGSLFSFGEGTEANVNPINETYSVISYSGNRIIMPPNATGVVINATETGNLTLNVQPNGLYIEQGQGFIVTEDGAAAEEEEEEEENATITFVLLSRTNPDGSGNGTGVTFFSTNSTGQLAFLDNMVGINDSVFSQGGGTIRVWEWKGGTVPFDTDN